MFLCVLDNSVLNTPPLVQCTTGCAGSRSNCTAKGAVCLLAFKTPLYSTPPTPTQCKAGYNGTGSNCTACPAGTYKIQTGVGDAASRIMLPVTHFFILSDASNALGQQYPAPYFRTPPHQCTAQRSVPATPKP